MLLLSDNIKGLDLCTFLLQMLDENAIAYQWSTQIFDNCILWLQAKPLPKEERGGNDDGAGGLGGADIDMDIETQMAQKYQYDNEFALIYHNQYTFEKDYLSGRLHSEMERLKIYANQRKKSNSEGDFKVILLLNSISDSLHSSDQN